MRQRESFIHGSRNAHMHVFTKTFHFKQSLEHSFSSPVWTKHHLLPMWLMSLSCMQTPCEFVWGHTRAHSTALQPNKVHLNKWIRVAQAPALTCQTEQSESQMRRRHLGSFWRNKLYNRKDKLAQVLNPTTENLQTQCYGSLEKVHLHPTWLWQKWLFELGIFWITHFFTHKSKPLSEGLPICVLAT